jgi:hypothetical protein
MREKVNGKDEREKERQGEVKCARNSTPEDASPKGTVALDFFIYGFFHQKYLPGPPIHTRKCLCLPLGVKK